MSPPQSRSAPPLVILGAGYTGRVVLELARQQGRAVYATSRFPEQHLTELLPSQRLRFDLLDSGTWSIIPNDVDLLWCFPAMPPVQAIAFAKTIAPKARRLVVLGSTSAYRPSGTVIDETASVDRTFPRVESEEVLRESYGAIVLRLAGIYGPGRHPLNWIRQGRIGYTERYVNLIHVEDIARICLALLERGMPGDVYLGSDGTPRRWRDICDRANNVWGIPLPPPSPARDPGKLISNEKVRTVLGYRFKYPDLFEALAVIEPPQQSQKRRE